MTFYTQSEEETIALGRQLAPTLQGIVLLIGNLGAGKTTLTKGIADGKGIPADAVSSPTFTLIHQYSEDLFHVDLYRLDEPREVETLGLNDLFNSGSLVLLEWAERFPELLPANRTEIRIETLPDETRRIEVTSGGPSGSSDAKPKLCPTCLFGSK